MKKTQEYHNFNFAARFELLTWGVAAASIISLFTAPFQPNATLKTVIAANSLLIASLARQASRGGSFAGSRADDQRDVADQMFTQELATSMFTELPMPGRDERVSSKPRKMFKIENIITEKEKYPHVIIVGATGSGKTLLAEYLVDKDKKNTVNTFVSPSRDDDEFIDYDYVGYGHNYNAISQFMFSVVSEMEQRYKVARDAVIAQYGFRNVILDEGTSTAKNARGFSQNLLTLISQARKRFIRVWMCTTAQTVAALNIKGEGESRGNFTYICLGDEAVSEVRRLIREGVYTQADLDWFEDEAENIDNGEYRLAVVDDMMCILPDLSDYRRHKRELGAQPPTEPKDPLLLSLPNKDDTQKSEVDYDAVQEMLAGGASKTATAKKFGVSGERERREFWAGYEAHHAN